MDWQKFDYFFAEEPIEEMDELKEALEEYNRIFQSYEPGERPTDAQMRVLALEEWFAAQGYLLKRVARHTFELVGKRQEPECPPGFFWNGRQFLRETPYPAVSLVERLGL